MSTKQYVVYQVVWSPLRISTNGVNIGFDNKADAMNHIKNSNPIGQYVLVDFGIPPNKNGEAIYFEPIK